MTVTDRDVDPAQEPVPTDPDRATVRRTMVCTACCAGWEVELPASGPELHCKCCGRVGQFRGAPIGRLRL